MQKPIYLDYSATTPVDPRVVTVMTECLSLAGNFGNPASRSHVYGWKAEQAVEEARREVADLIHAGPREIVWTSGATESDNLAIKGAAWANRERGKHIITSSIEHKAVLDTCNFLETEGFELTYLPPAADGLTTAEAVRDAIREDTILVSIMHANNELGVVNDIAVIGELCREHNILFHTDGAQSVGKIEVDLSALKVDLMSMTAHKMYGPKGVGALYVRRAAGVKIRAQIHGGGHERGMRSGTLATHQIAGMGEAARIAREEMPQEEPRIVALRDRFWAQLADIDGLHINGDAASRVPGVLNIGVEGVEGETLLLSLKELALSTGSACNSASVEPSYVLHALGVADHLAHSSLRFSFGRYTTEEEIDYAASQFSNAISTLR